MKATCTRGIVVAMLAIDLKLSLLTFTVLPFMALALFTAIVAQSLLPSLRFST